MNFASTCAELAATGFSLLPPLISDSALNHLTAALEAHLPQQQTTTKSAGHRHLHTQVPAITRFIEAAPIQNLLSSTLPGAFIVRSILFDKTPDANWKVPWHQDLTICAREKHEHPGFTAWSNKDGLNHVQPPTEILECMLTLRLHLDPCGPENGPLQILPGTHRQGRLSAAQIQTIRTKIQPQTCACPRGAILLMKPLILHASSQATAPNHRRILHLEFASTPLPPPLAW